MRRGKTRMTLNSLEVYSSSSPQYSHLTWLLARLSLSLSGLTELSSASELRPGQRSTQRTPFHTAGPTVAKETQAIMLECQWQWPSTILCSSRSLTVLLSCVELPLLASAILLHRWKCLTLRAETWASSLASSCLFLCRLSWQSSKKAEVRCVVSFDAKMAT